LPAVQVVETETVEVAVVQGDIAHQLPEKVLVGELQLSRSFR
jgi:hypothetical protein